MTYQYRAEKGFIASLVKDNLTFYGRDLLAFDRLEFTEKPRIIYAKRTLFKIIPFFNTNRLKHHHGFTLRSTKKTENHTKNRC